MLLKSLMKKIENTAKINVRFNDVNGKAYHTASNGRAIMTWEMYVGYDDVCQLRVRKVDDKDDMQSDWCAGHFFDTIKDAIKYFNEGAF